MSIAIGTFLTQLREKIGVSQKDICEGICKISTYSNYERDERIPDFLTLNLILERLGHGIMSLGVYVTEEEAKYLQWRTDTADILRNQRYTDLTVLIEKEPKKCVSFNENIRKQYSLYLRGVVAEKKEKNLTKALKYYEEAIHFTCPFLLENEKFSTRIGKLELGIYAVYLRLLTKLYPEKQDEVIGELTKLMKYVLEQFPDEAEQVKSYPHLVCIWAHISFQHISLNSILTALMGAYCLLKKQGKMYHVTEVLRLICACRDEAEEGMYSEEKDYQVICQIYRLFNKSIEFNPYEICENIWMLTMVGDYLAKNRRKRELTQEEISDGICAVESYSRIENSKRFPNRRNYGALTRRLKIEPRYFMEIINTSSYRAIMLRREISRALYCGEFINGRELLKALKEELGADREKNIQYLEEIEILCSYGIKEIPAEIRQKRLLEILSYTLNIEDIGKNRHIYTKVEIDLINQLAVSSELIKDYMGGVLLLKNFLEDIASSQIELEQRFIETYLAALNLDKLLTDLGRFEEGNELCMKWAKMAVDRGHAFLLDDYLLEISYNMEHMQNNISDSPQKICHLARGISDIYGTSKRRKLIQSYYNEHYGE